MEIIEVCNLDVTNRYVFHTCELLSQQTGNFGEQF
jgi:hypothetical protein